MQVLLIALSLAAVICLSDACSAGSNPTPVPPGICGNPLVKQSRIIAGVTAKPGAWPWMASLWMNGRSHICGGTILNARWILTASHCVVGTGATTSTMQIKVGEHDHSSNDGNEQTHNIERIIPHSSYDKQQLTNDIALIKLRTPIRINSRAMPICLPSKGTRPNVGSLKCYLSGWGTVTHPGSSAKVLQQAMLPVAETRKCFNRRDMICAGYGGKTTSNACRGDSGGPFVCQRSDGSWEQQGVASFVVEYCKYYTAFTPVSSYIDWINTNMQS